MSIINWSAEVVSPVEEPVINWSAEVVSPVEEPETTAAVHNNNDNDEKVTGNDGISKQSNDVGIDPEIKQAVCMQCWNGMARITTKPESYGNANVICDLCHVTWSATTTEGPFWHCVRCEFDLCKSCASSQQASTHIYLEGRRGDQIWNDIPPVPAVPRSGRIDGRRPNIYLEGRLGNQIWNDIPLVPAVPGSGRIPSWIPAKATMAKARGAKAEMATIAKPALPALARGAKRALPASIAKAREAKATMAKAEMATIAKPTLPALARGAKRALPAGSAARGAKRALPG
jgi:hypothetical protein